MTRTITEAEFTAAQDAIDELAVATRRGRKGSEEELARFRRVYDGWEALMATPDRRADERQVRAAALYDFAAKEGLL
jgi:hypothetical protein